MTDMTERQTQVLEALNAGKAAREIAEDLGISRNAVYAQITALKRKNVLPADWTPTGEVRTPAHLVAGRAPQDAPAYMDVIKELVDMNRQLVNMLEQRTSDVAAREPAKARKG